MNKPSLRQRFLPLLFTFLAAIAGIAMADPPSRVARLSYTSGVASFSPAGEREWVRAVINRPLTTGDRLWVEPGARAELQMGTAAVRIGGATNVALLNLDDRVAQVQLSQGSLAIRVRAMARGQVFEVATPNLSYVIRSPGSYRIDVDPRDDVTTVSVRTGQADVYGERRAFTIREKQTYSFYGEGLREYRSYAALRTDALDRWSAERDRRWDNSPSRRYVSAELIGYEDLDANGTWRKHPQYGSIWFPNRVPSDWAPYRDGHWSWVEPWGWTWIDEQPWGFASTHYGRWAQVDNRWGWIPGPVSVRPVYAPALVAFVGGDNFRGGNGGGNTVGWFPLGPREVYRPPYTVSRDYFTNVNTSNTIVNRTVVVGDYERRDAPATSYVNQQVPGAIVAMLAAAFAQSKPVARERVEVRKEVAVAAPPRVVPQVAPVAASVTGAAPAVAVKPPEPAHARPVVAQTAPPPPVAPFAARQGQIAANVGKPHDTAAAAAAKPATPPPAPAVTVVTPEKPVAPPPRPASAPQPAAPASSPAAQAPAAPPPPAAAPPAAATPPAPPAPPQPATPPSRPPRSAPPAASAPAEPPKPAGPPAEPAKPAPTPEAAKPAPAPAEPAKPAPPPPPAPPRAAPAASAPPGAAPRASAPAPAPAPARETPKPPPTPPAPPAQPPAPPAAQAASSAPPPAAAAPAPPRPGRAEQPASAASEPRALRPRLHASGPRDAASERRRRDDEEGGRKP